MLTAAVIGAGIMGAGLESEPALVSHAQVFSLHSGIELLGLIDNDRNKLKAAINRWGGSGYSKIEDFITRVVPDIISICVPDEQHEIILEKLLAYKPRLVILEKPCTTNPIKTRQLIEKFSIQGIPVLVNYPRRYLQIYRDLKQWCMDEGVLSATIRYAKGIKHNGCHAIDLGRLLFGEVLDWKLLGSRIDYKENDPSVSAFIKYEHCEEFFLQALDERHYTHFELDVFTRAGRFIIDNDHLRLRKYRVSKNTGIPSGNRIVEEELKNIDHAAALTHLINNAVSVLENNKLPIYSMSEAVKSEQIAYQMSEQSL